MSDANPNSEIRNPQYIVSIAFWLALVSAAGLYGIVALSPKLVTCLDERDRWRENQERLVRLERKVEFLKRVADALEHDPEFASELARVELNAARTGDERIPVNGSLGLPTADTKPVETRSAEQAWFRPALEEFATDRERRTWLLVGAAAIAVFAFTFLHERPPKSINDADVNRSWFSRRYRRSSAS